MLKDILIPLGSALATLVAGFGGVFLGALLTDKRRKDEERQNNINKIRFLLQYTEKYLMCLLQYRERFINKNLEAIENLPQSNDCFSATSPYVSLKFDIELDDFSFLINSNCAIISVLHMILYYSNSLNNHIQNRDKYIEKVGFMQLEGKNEQINKHCFTDMTVSMIRSIDVTQKDILLYKNLVKLLTETYKQQISYNEDIFKRDLQKDMEHNTGFNTWIEYINNSWEN